VATDRISLQQIFPSTLSKALL